MIICNYKFYNCPLCFWSKILVATLCILLIIQLVKKTLWKLGDFNVKLTINDKKWLNHGTIKIKNKKCIGRISIHFIIKFCFDTTMTYFFNNFFLYCMCDRWTMIILKVHYESTLFLEFIHFFNMDSIVKFIAKIYN